MIPEIALINITGHNFKNNCVSVNSGCQNLYSEASSKAEINIINTM